MCAQRGPFPTLSQSATHSLLNNCYVLGTVASGNWTAAVTESEPCPRLTAGPNPWRRLRQHGTPLWPGLNTYLLGRGEACCRNGSCLYPRALHQQRRGVLGGEKSTHGMGRVGGATLQKHMWQECKLCRCLRPYIHAGTQAGQWTRGNGRGRPTSP